MRILANEATSARCDRMSGNNVKRMSLRLVMTALSSCLWLGLLVTLLNFCATAVVVDDDVMEAVRRKEGWPSLVVAKMGVASPPASNVVAESLRKGVKECDLWRPCPLPASGWPRRTQDDKIPPVLLRLESEL